MNSRNPKKWLSILKFLPFVMCIFFIICYISSGEEITVQTLLKYTPENPLGAAFMLFFMYTAKSVSIIFPLIILEIAGGHLFPTVTALIINTLGIMICHTTAYWIGRVSGTTVINKLVQKYKTFASLLKNQNNNSFFMCFFLRTLHCIPGDVVSMYLGATKTPYWCYLLASTLGSLPSTILATLFGANITEPSSPMFWISILLMTLLAGFSLLAYYLYKYKLQKGNN